MASRSNLRRTLGLPLVTLYGLGNILGAGIYVLIGKVAGLAGTGTTLAFVLAMITAGLTAFSYMELASRYPVSASISVYIHNAFGKRWLSVLIGLAMVAGGIASAAALAQGFAGYLGAFVAVPESIASVGAIVILGLIALRGIGESAKFAAVLTLIEVSGLLMFIWFGKQALSHVEPATIFAVDPVMGVSGLVAGSFLAFYAFIGFEDMVNISEEVKNPRKTMPLAIVAALGISTALYLLVAIISTILVEPADLAASSAPLALVLQRSGLEAAGLLAAVGVVATINGVIVQIIMGSRILYGLSSQGWIIGHFSKVHPQYKTPTIATAVVLVAMVVATLLLPLVSLAQVTSMLVLSIFALVNVSLVVLQRRRGRRREYITVPRVVPYLGAILCVAMIGYQLYVWL